MNNQKVKKRNNRVILFIIELIKRIINHDLTMTAGFLAYNLIIAIIPFCMFLLSIIGKSELKVDTIFNFIKFLIPESSYSLLRYTITEIMNEQGSKIVWVTIVLAVWAASHGFAAVIRGLNRAYGVKEKRGYLSRMIRSILSTIILALLIILIMILLVFGDLIRNAVIRSIPIHHLITICWDILRYFVLIGMLLFTFIFMYKFTPAKRLTWIQVIPGAIFTTIGWLVVSTCFAFYVNSFSNYSRIYGSFAAIFILMTWMYLSSFILLIGGEINALLLEDESLDDI